MRKPRGVFLFAIVVPFTAVPAVPAIADEDDSPNGILERCQQQRGPVADTQLPPVDTTPCSDDADKAKLRSLIQQLRNIKQKSDLTRVEYEVAQCVRDAERDSVWGFSGSLGRFSNGLLGLATLADGAPPWADWANTGISVLQDPGSARTWVEAGSDVVGSEQFLNAAAKQQIAQNVSRLSGMTEQDAAQLVSNQLAQAGKKEAEEFLNGVEVPNVPGVTIGGLKEFGDAVGFVTAVTGSIEATDSLTADLSAYYQARAEANGLRSTLDDLDRQIDELTHQIAELRDKCRSPKTKTDCKHSQPDGTIGFCRKCVCK